MSRVSVVICTYKRPGRLQRALEALGRQTVGPEQFEVVVVDDGSEDGTNEVCHAMRAVLPNLRYVANDENLGVARSRNVGMTTARGQYILFTDDDCIPAPGWVESMTRALRRHAIVAGAIATPHRSYFKLCHNVAEFNGFMPGCPSGSRSVIIGGNMGFRRTVLEQVEGFRRVTRYAEDMEFIFRARQQGYSATFVPEAVVTHDPDRTTFQEIFRYAMAHGASSVVLRNRYGSLLRTPFVLRSAPALLLAAPLMALAVTVRIFVTNPRAARWFTTVPIVYVLKLGWCLGAALELSRGDFPGEAA